MRQLSIEAVSKQVAAASTRRGMLAALLAGGLLAPRHAAEAAFGFCRIPGQPCGKDVQCCANTCRSDGTCGCRKRGKPAAIGAICCSGKAKQGKCR
jgi:hypothetical protein